MLGTGIRSPFEEGLRQFGFVQRATTTIPIVMVLATDPVRLGFVSSLARPAGNITGLSMQTPELAGKRLQLLKEVVPDLTRVDLQSFEVRSGRDLGGAFAAMTRERVGAVIVDGSSLPFAQRAMISELAARNRLVTMSTAREWMDASFVMSYGPSLDEMYRRAPYFVDKILKEAKPADLPVEQPTRFEMAINAKSAKAIGVTIPPSLPMRAEHVME